MRESCSSATQRSAGTPSMAGASNREQRQITSGLASRARASKSRRADLFHHRIVLPQKLLSGLLGPGAFGQNATRTAAWAGIFRLRAVGVGLRPANSLQADPAAAASSLATQQRRSNEMAVGSVDRPSAWMAAVRTKSSVLPSSFRDMARHRQRGQLHAESPDSIFSKSCRQGCRERRFARLASPEAAILQSFCTAASASDHFARINPSAALMRAGDCSRLERRSRPGPVGRQDFQRAVNLCSNPTWHLRRGYFLQCRNGSTEPIAPRAVQAAGFADLGPKRHRFRSSSSQCVRSLRSAGHRKILQQTQ